MTERLARRMAGAALMAALVLLGGCGSSEPSKTPEQVAAEQAAAREKAKQGALGTQVQALDKAATVQGTVDAQGDATRDAVDAQTGDAPVDVQTSDAPADAAATAPPP